MVNDVYYAKAIYNRGGHELISPGDKLIVHSDQVFNVTKGIDLVIEDISPYADPADIEIKEGKVYVHDPHQKNVNKHNEILGELSGIYIKKNHDYGNSFEQSLDEEGLAAARIRMGDKWNRFKQLSKRDNVLVKDESIRDTLLDMANYAIMTAMWLDKNS